MKAINFRELESETEILIKTCQRLKEENRFLLERQNHLLHEKNELIEKNKQAVEKINDIIGRLTAEEHAHAK